MLFLIKLLLSSLTLTIYMYECEIGTKNPISIKFKMNIQILYYKLI